MSLGEYSFLLGKTKKRAKKQIGREVELEMMRTQWRGESELDRGVVEKGENKGGESGVGVEE